MQTSSTGAGQGLEGDPRRQAVASLRGYAYQLYASALAWLALGPNEELHLEVAEDYAVLGRRAVEAVQVKDIAGSGNLTIRHAAVRETLDAFVDLVARNPTRRVTLRFLTTAEVGREQAAEDRPDNEPALDYWRRAAAGADLQPLRKVLDRLRLGKNTRTFIAARSDEDLRVDLLQRIHWDCGSGDIRTLERQLHLVLDQVAREAGQDLRPGELPQAAANLLFQVLGAALNPSDRVLTVADRAEVLAAFGEVTVRRRSLEALIRKLGDEVTATIHAPGVLRPESETPLPSLLVPRIAVSATLVAPLLKEGFVVLHGATGAGKSLLARLAVRSLGDWMIADFREVSEAETVARLDAALGELGRLSCRGVILDDLNTLDDQRVATALARFRLALSRQDRLCLVTSYLAPSARRRSDLGISASAVTRAPYLTVPEVTELVQRAGGENSAWGAVIHLASASGHPQLVQANLAYAQSQAWSDAAFEALALLSHDNEPLSEERGFARRRLMDTTPEAARALIYRLSILVGSFTRDLALKVGDAPPPISLAGEHLDRLVGPWIDPIGSRRLRISPLLQDVSEVSLSNEMRDAVHRIAAEHLLGGEQFDVQDANAGLVHGMLAKADEPLTRLALSVIGAPSEDLTRLADWLPAVRALRSDHPIYPSNPRISLMLRLAQVLLDANAPEGGRLAERWQALKSELNEIDDVGQREKLELLAYAKVLLSARASELPDWVDELAQFSGLIQGTDFDLQPAEPEAPEQPAEPPSAFYFLNLVVQVRSVAQLAHVFDRLDRLSPDIRNRLLARLQERPSEVAHVISHPWMLEHQDKTIDGRAAADLYAKMANQAIAWGEDGIAAHCAIAQSVMLEEYVDDEPAALKVLDQAQSAFGDRTALLRARGKIAFRRDRYAEALALFERVVARPPDDMVERVFVCREAAISAAKLDRLGESLSWFQTAAAAARSVNSPTMRLMAIGLSADTALMAFRTGQADAALVGLAEALDASEAFPPESSLKAYFLNKALGVACLWTQAQLTGHRYEMDGLKVMAPPGFCSNPDPSEEIRALPAVPPTGGLYMLADADVARGGALGLESRLRAKLAGGHIFTLETMLRRTRLSRAIELLDYKDMPGLIVEALEATLLAAEKMRGPDDPSTMALKSAPFPRLPVNQRRDSPAVSFLNDALFAVRLTAHLKDRLEPDAIARVEAAIVEKGYPASDFLEANSDSSKDAYWREVAKPVEVAEDLFVLCLHLLDWTQGSLFGDTLLPPLGEWAGQEWRRMVEQQRFRLRNPAMTAQAIEDAIAIEAPRRRYVAILKAARPGFKFNLPASIVARLDEG